MLNFLTNVFQKKTSARNICGGYNNGNDVIQECAGCDSECKFSCFSMCANLCLESTQESGGGGNSGGCNGDCEGTCFSVVSIIIGK